MNSFKRHKHGILLAALVGVALIESFSHRQVLSDLVVMTTTLLVFLIVFERRLSRMVAFIAFAVVLGVVLAQYILPPSYSEHPLRLVYHSAALLFFGFAAIVILRNIFERGVVRADDMFGALCGYLLVAAAWSDLFSLIEIFLPGSFSVGPGFAGGMNTWHGRIAVMSYVSFGALTTIGSGAIAVLRPPATILTRLEAVFGQFYIAVVVAELVSARLSQRS
jgi:hypothetical protein